MNTAASDEHVRAVVQVVGEMHKWPSMGRGLSRLKPRDFQSQIGEGGLALTSEFRICWRDLWEDFSGDGETLAVDEV